MKKETGKILIDIAKLVIGGVILAGLMRQDNTARISVYGWWYSGAVNDFRGACFNIMERKK
jgi:hypothetical protein